MIFKTKYTHHSGFKDDTDFIGIDYQGNSWIVPKNGKSRISESWSESVCENMCVMGVYVKKYYKHTYYTLTDKPSFNDGDLVYVDMKIMGAADFRIMPGKIVGKVSDHIIDLWIVDFGKTLSCDGKYSNYPFKVLAVIHTAIIKE